jgi:hypothetical protein
MPFERSADARGVSPTEAFALAEIPAGTPVTVRLQASLSSTSSHMGDSFDAVLDEPIVVRGQTVVPQGTTITGKVLEARPSGQLRDPGYLRVVLTAVLLNGKVTSMQTSSIFAKGGPRGKRNPPLMGTSLTSARKGDTAAVSDQEDVRYDTEHRLIFRLTEPLPLRG